ncbi:4Fe-4S dicluster domain-containing protein [Clostridium folliculivorans]|uniref:(Fe-S)-binding protein n=1 Tax=Clostridium folliculivorans TaxID=2886038 RepID=A0A9W5Y5Q1_9CLOT|nr:4Fe-4S dicluster domain-containing protein [Clostridium folliculivorans]GKU27052.1 (Fe-S)-binding protein [Clostridium folliculivorans]GKU29106.1 (Fe-S)-binding protein [Clostridium folliculivorans]
MSHISNKNAYKMLEERINRFPQGAPPSKTLYKILSMLFTEKEAELVAMLPIKPFTLKTASQIWKMSEVETQNILEKLASKAIIMDIDFDGKKEYCLPPPMIGFFEFSLMRTRDDIDQKTLSELYYQYLNVEEDFIKDLFLGTETRFGKVFVQEGVLSRQNELEIMDYDRASNVIKEAKHIAVSMCFCRHKMQHLGENCDAPMETCITLGNTAHTLSKNGYARTIDASEGLDILNMAYEHNLVQCGENVRNGSVFMCNCCGCCCEGMLAVKKFGYMAPIQTTAFLPQVTDESCVGCGKCSKVCPIEAIKVDPITKKAKVDEGICLGCGVCVRNCPKKSIYLKHRGKEIITPANTTHRIVLQAIEKGQLSELLFDNKALFSHRAMAAVFSSILKLPPLKRAMASKQMKSVYLDKLLRDKE